MAVKSFPDVAWNRGATTKPSPPELNALSELLWPGYVIVGEHVRAEQGKCGGCRFRVYRLIETSQTFLYKELEAN